MKPSPLLLLAAGTALVLCAGAAASVLPGSAWGQALAAGSAAAEQVAEPPPAAAAAPATAPAAGSAAAPAPASNLPEQYVSPMRAQCEQELRKDAVWHAELRDQLRREVRVQDASEFLRNKRHLVMAYGAIWLGTLVFLVILWRRQRRFEVEIERLSRDLLEATREHE